MKRLIKKASVDYNLHSFIAYCTPIELSVRWTANRMWFSVVVDYPAGAASLYDGDDYDRAFDIYIEAILAFNGVTEAEKLAKLKDKLYEDAKIFVGNEHVKKQREQRTLYQRKKLFLGGNDAI